MAGVPSDAFGVLPSLEAGKLEAGRKGKIEWPFGFFVRLQAFSALFGF